MVTVITRDVPYVPEQERIRVEVLDDRFQRVFVYYGLKINLIFQMHLNWLISNLKLNLI
jgi:K+ transporter